MKQRYYVDLTCPLCKTKHRYLITIDDVKKLNKEEKAQP